MEASFLLDNDSFQSRTALSRAAESDGAEGKDKQRRGRGEGEVGDGTDGEREQKVAMHLKLILNVQSGPLGGS